MIATEIITTFPPLGLGLKFVGNKVAFHPLAEIFPLLPDAELRALKDDIAKNGLHEPIVVFDGQILDGRNRLLACRALNSGWKFVGYTGADPLGFVISKNLHRRHLNESQRAMIAGRVARMKQGARTDLAQICAKSQSDAAKLVNIGKRSVQDARKVLHKGSAALIDAVEDGAVAVSVAAKLADLPQSVQAAACATPEKAAHIVKQQTRQDRETELAGRQTALPDKRYGVIVAVFEPWSGDTGVDHGVDNATTPVEAISAREVASIAAPDCVLFLWATSPVLPQALAVMEAWGFSYVSNFVWNKDHVGTGYWVRSKHELNLRHAAARQPMVYGGCSYPKDEVAYD